MMPSQKAHQASTTLPTTRTPTITSRLLTRVLLLLSIWFLREDAANQLSRKSTYAS